jgi:hypothetical protein
MFRQIAPGGIVNKEIMNRKVDPSDALDPVVPETDGVKIAEEHNDPSSEHTNDPAPKEIVPKQISNGTGEPANAFVPHQGADTEKSAEKPDSESTSVAQEIVASAAENGADTELSKPASNFDPATSTSNIEESTTENEQNGEKVDESHVTGTYDAVDEHLESSAENVHPHPSDMEEAVKPAAGEAVAAPADSSETRMTHEEMSSLSNASECPFLMNRE